MAIEDFKFVYLEKTKYPSRYSCNPHFDAYAQDCGEYLQFLTDTYKELVEDWQLDEYDLHDICQPKPVDFYKS